jgi:hypothetical protein
MFAAQMVLHHRVEIAYAQINHPLLFRPAK